MVFRCSRCSVSPNWFRTREHMEHQNTTNTRVSRSLTDAVTYPATVTLLQNTEHREHGNTGTPRTLLTPTTALPCDGLLPTALGGRRYLSHNLNNLLGLPTQADALSQLRPPSSVIWGHHGIAGRQAPPLTILVRGQVVLRNT